MSQATEILYTARVRAPQVLERGRDQLTSLAIYRDGEIVAPVLGQNGAYGTYTLLSPTGTAIVDAALIDTLTNSIAEYTVLAASLPSTLAYGEGYTERWFFPELTTEVDRTFTRECSIAKFQLAPSITDLDLLAEYPDLLELLGAYNTHLQSWIDEAFVQFLNDLYSLGEWPDVIVTRAATRKPLKERAYFLIYKFLFSKQPNAGRFETLMNFHQSEMNAAFKGMSYRVDRDQDGTPDGLDRHSSTTVVHRNAAPRRIMRRSTRW